MAEDERDTGRTMQDRKEADADWLDANRKAWDTRTQVHLDSAFYDKEAVAEGASSLFDTETRLVGEVSGLELLHLQCHFGLDSLCWARRGAGVTGVDLSPVAIEEARCLFRECGTPGTFLCADAQDLPPQLAGKFDKAVSTYGVLPWIRNLGGWAASIRRCLKPGGRFALVEFHPLLEILHPGSFSGRGGYFSDSRALVTATKGTYAAPDSSIEYEECRWQHSLADVVRAVLGAGLEIERLEEHGFMHHQLIPGLARSGDGAWVEADRPGERPLMFSLLARR